MCKDTTAVRLRQLMEERNLRQVDILNMVEPFCKKYHVKMNRSDISQYVSGKVEPHQEKLFILGNALGVSEAWLMGFNVPRERKTSEEVERFSTTTVVWNDEHKHTVKLSDYEFDIINKIRHIDGYGKNAVDAVINAEYERCINTKSLTYAEIEKYKLTPYMNDNNLAARNSNNKD